jgi:predicted permease
MAWRHLRRAPGPALFAVVTLTLGIGAATATYCVVGTGLWRPLGIADPDRVAIVSRTNAYSPGPADVSRVDFEAIDSGRASVGVDSVAAWRRFDATIVGHGSAVIGYGEFVSADYFRMLGVPASLGRTLDANDSASDAAAQVAVLSDAAWRSQFSNAPDVVGQVIKVANRTFKVIGVAPIGFRGVHQQAITYPSVWLPLRAAPALLESLGWPAGSPKNVTVGARVGSSRTTAEVSSALTAFGESLDRRAPLTPTRLPDGTTPPRLRHWAVAGVTDDASFDQASEMGRLIILLPGLVLLVACTNIANLVLSRGASRQQEFAVRRAIGATRWQLIRAQLVEHLLVAAVGGAGAAIFAWRLIQLARHVTETSLAPFTNGAPIDWHMTDGLLPGAVFGIGVSLLVAGLIPALHLTRDSLRTVMAQGDATSSPRWRGRGNLIALQLGVSVGLCLIALAFVRLTVVNGGFKLRPGTQAPSRMLALAQVPFGLQGRTPTFERDYVARALDSLAHAPDVESAAAMTDASVLPGMGGLPAAAVFGGAVDVAIHVAERPRAVVHPSVTSVTPSYFATSGVPWIAGRSFDAGTADGAVVSATLARNLFGTTDVIGRELTLTTRDRMRADAIDETSRRTITGVVADSEPAVKGRRSAAVLYLPIDSASLDQVTFLARGRDAGPIPTDALRHALASTDPEIAVAFVSTNAIVTGGPAAFLADIGLALLALAALALGLATVGLYGVLSHVMSRRTREIGIRVALGATPRAITTLVLRDGFRPIVEGLFIGLASATVIRWLIGRSLVQMTRVPIDPLEWGLCMALVTVAGLVACWRPARRATRVTPTTALRSL